MIKWTGTISLLFMAATALAQPGTITVKKKKDSIVTKVESPLQGLYITGKIKTNFNGTKAKKPYYSCLFFYENGKVFQFFSTKKPKEIYEMATMRPYELKVNKGYYNCNGAKLKIETSREKETSGKGGIDYIAATYYEGNIGNSGILVHQKFAGRTIISNLFKPYPNK